MLTQNISGIQIISNISPNIRPSTSRCLESKDLACHVLGIGNLHHLAWHKDHPTKKNCSLVLTTMMTATIELPA